MDEQDGQEKAKTQIKIPLFLKFDTCGENSYQHSADSKDQKHLPPPSPADLSPTGEREQGQVSRSGYL